MWVPWCFFLLGGFRRVKSVYGVQEASYNSMRRQIGYCRMQSFETVSRTTTDSVSMFMDGRISFGVGLPLRDASSMEAFPCGVCLNVTHVENFYTWNFNLTEWFGPWPTDQWFLVMVFDECRDTVCQQAHYLDFDVYSETQPVAHGNPYGIQWHVVPCPLRSGETLEYLFCTASTCHENDLSKMIPLAVEEYWSLTVRNFRIGIVQVSVLYHDVWRGLRRENAWVWDQGPFDLGRNLQLMLTNSEGMTITDTVRMGKGHRHESYHGAWVVSSEQNL